jgi:hypothetical protein
MPQNMKLKALLMGMTSYAPVLHKFISRGTGGTISARYCYSVWLRHLIMAHQNGQAALPEVVAEIGPGDSLGIGLAALLSGASRYYAFDIVAFSNKERNLEVFKELVDLFEKRERIPDEREFPELRPCLECYDFPDHILIDAHLREALKRSRTKLIRDAILDKNSSGNKDIDIAYFVPWYDAGFLKPATVDMIYSQAVMEHVDGLENTFKALRVWLKPGGLTSHQIDFKCHGTAKQWNGHWAYSDLVWRIIKGKKPYLLNRQSHSAYIELLQRTGFDVVCDIKIKAPSGIRREQLAARFKNMSDDDLTTSDAFIQAIKK